MYSFLEINLHNLHDIANLLIINELQRVGLTYTNLHKPTRNANLHDF